MGAKKENKDLSSREGTKGLICLKFGIAGDQSALPVSTLAAVVSGSVVGASVVGGCVVGASVGASVAAGVSAVFTRTQPVNSSSAAKRRPNTRLLMVVPLSHWVYI